MTESVTDELLAHAGDYPSRYVPGEQTPRPRKHLAVVACMDARLDLFSLLGLESGDVHLLRNAGGVVTDDVIRSLVISQRALGTHEVILIHHTDCGMLRLSADVFMNELMVETGMRPTWALENFTDIDADLRQSLARIRTSAFIPHRDRVRGFVFEVENGNLREVFEQR